MSEQIALVLRRITYGHSVFIVTHNLENKETVVEAALRTAIQDFLASPDAQYLATWKHFDWVDAAWRVPGEHWQRYGIEQIQPVADSITADVNENFAQRRAWSASGVVISGGRLHSQLAR